MANQRQCNSRRSSMRHTITRCNKLLKRLWRKLHLLDHLDMELRLLLMISTCVLHNFLSFMMTLTIMKMMGMVALRLLSKEGLRKRGCTLWDCCDYLSRCICTIVIRPKHNQGDKVYCNMFKFSYK